MPVNSTHPDYEAFATDWCRARDVLAGEDAVKAGGDKYLPRIGYQRPDEYCAYRSRAAFFNATARTAEGYVGLIFRRAPFIKVPVEVGEGRRENGEGRGQRSGAPPLATRPSSLSLALSDFLHDADLLGSSFGAYAKDIVNEVIGVGRAGSLVDWESDTEQRAYVTLYSAEQIINWRVERVKGRSVPTMIVLRESGRRKQTGGGRWEMGGGEGSPESRVQSPKSKADPFVEERVEQIRVLRLVEGDAQAGKDAFHRVPRGSGGVRDAVESVPTGGQRVCVVEIWQPKETKNKRNAKPEWQLVETRIPLRLGKPLPLIPFVFHGPRHSRPNVDKLPLNDLITVNLDHYRLDADYKHGLHFTALPTAWVSGFEKSSTLRIGSSTAWVAETPGATAGYLEFTGQGLTSFERALDRDERLMAVLGSRLLEDQKKVGETATAIELRQSGENSILSSIATSVSESLTQVLRWVYWWNSTEELPDDFTESQVLVKLNTDFSLKGMTSGELQAVVKAWQAGAISRDTMLELFRKGEILPDGRTNEEEERLAGAPANGLNR